MNLIEKMNIHLFQGNRKAILFGILGLGVLLHGCMGIDSTSKAISASGPTQTFTLAPTVTITITSTSTITYTPSTAPNKTTTQSLTETKTPTASLTQSAMITPTQDRSFFDIASCLPKGNSFEKGFVTQVIDGDTINVRLADGKTYTVRYIGIDSPETGMPFYEEALNVNSNLVLNQQVILIIDVSETDAYGRLLRYIVADDKFINLELVKSGFAKAVLYAPDDACASTLADAEASAKELQLGIWAATPTAHLSAAQVIIVAVNKQAEYVDIKNMGNIDVDLAGWHLVSEKGNQGCSLTGIIKIGETLRIWSMTGEGGFSCGYTKPIWNNSEPDPAVLYNAEGVEVSRK